MRFLVLQKTPLPHCEEITSILWTNSYSVINEDSRTIGTYLFKVNNVKYVKSVQI